MERGELGSEGARVVALDQRFVLGTVTAVCDKMAAWVEGDGCIGDAKCPGARLKRFFLGRRTGGLEGVFAGGWPW